MGYLILFGWLVLLPVCAGGIFYSAKRTLAAQWVWGQFLLWAVFQAVAVPYITKERTLEELLPTYTVAALLLGAAGLLYAVKQVLGSNRRNFFRVDTKHKNVDNVPFKNRFMWMREEKVLVLLFSALYVVQLLMMICLAVNDGDDAFYMAVANQAQSSGVMYLANVYSFGAMTLNYRYALAPLPIWIAFLSKISGIHTLVIGHIILGVMLVTMSYVIYAQIGRELFGNLHKKRMGMLVLIALLYMWGNTSSHTPESFLMLRSRQGKALVAAIVFPALFYVLVKIGHALEQKHKIKGQNYLLASAIILTGCLGSTLGGSLVILLWGSALFLLAVGYRKWQLLPMGALCSLPGLIYVVLYIVKR